MLLARRIVKPPDPLQRTPPICTTEESNNQNCIAPVATLLLSTEDETFGFGRTLAKLASAGDLVTLSGPLGVGKTVLARGFITQRLGYNTDVASPTFTLVNVYDGVTPPIWHFDFYRLENPQDIEELGLDEALADGISIIEWPERAASWLPTERLDITLGIEAATRSRIVTLSASQAWAVRVEALIADLGVA